MFMDAHYHIVMNARENIKDTENRYYFAYSSVLDRDAFLEWRNEHSYFFFDLPKGSVAKALDIDLVFNFNSRWWGGRVAGLEKKKNSCVYGVLFDIPAKDWPVVQHKEGFITGMCIELPISVEVDNQIINATAFSTSPERATSQGPISSEYIKTLIRGAQSCELPMEYIEKLRTIKVS